ncbi:hypothetical protein [Geothrix sp. 21YS21S-4]|uniref:hypothetical protein n=1 Tax=Geothrix sp. 21YS21S-4 TaxID=3068889 RepID=UPI0027B8837B|nr:hypothetical protein [Geothrix sp. 21YS21S-4]
MDDARYEERQVSLLRTNASTLSLGCDYLYFIAEKPERFYFTLGVAMAYWSFDQDQGAGKLTRHSTKPSAAAGVGYQWSATLGAEIRYLHGTTVQTASADAVQAGITLRF